MTTLVTFWWLSFWTVLGLCLGSFLNAVIYRIPRRCSLRDPLWSACPHCRHRIDWYDNLPVISFVLLRGRCRSCGVPISTQYIVVEVAMALIVLMLLDAFVVGRVRGGLSGSDFLTDRIFVDWPILLAHIILFACLLAMSAIDLEHYWVDIRFTNFVTVSGFVLHTIWTPRHGTSWVRPFDATAASAILAVAGLILVWIWLMSLPEHEPEQPDEPEDEESLTQPPTTAEPRRPPPSLASPSRLAGWLALMLLVALFVALVAREAYDVPLRHTGRAILPLAFLFILIVSESTIVRASDQAVVDAIHEERHGARRMVLSELLLLLPALALGLLGLWIMSAGGELATRISAALHTEILIDRVAMFRHWSPAQGFATAAAGYIIAGGLGWTVRIVFTLVFGKEAFGAGDIHMMAAAGCVAGWPVVVIGFFLTCALALLGWLATLPFKRTRALPLGPWLSLSFLIVVVFYEPIVRWPAIAHTIDLARMVFLDNSQLPQPGILP